MAVVQQPTSNHFQSNFVINFRVQSYIESDCLLVVGSTPVVRIRITYSEPPVSLLKTAFLKIIPLQQKQKYQSDPIQSRVRSDPQSDPIQAIQSGFC